MIDYHLSFQLVLMPGLFSQALYGLLPLLQPGLPLLKLAVSLDRLFLPNTGTGK